MYGIWIHWVQTDRQSKIHLYIYIYRFVWLFLYLVYFNIIYRLHFLSFLTVHLMYICTSSCTSNVIYLYKYLYIHMCPKTLTYLCSPKQPEYRVSVCLKTALACFLQSVTPSEVRVPLTWSFQRVRGRPLRRWPSTIFVSAERLHPSERHGRASGTAVY